MIRYENGAYHYFDRNGTELHDGDTVLYESGETQKLYPTENGQLGTDATNPVWIADGSAVPCEYGIYPLEEEETEEIVKNLKKPITAGGDNFGGDGLVFCTEERQFLSFRSL